jgi:tryptophan synthase alpha chain
VKAGLDGSGKPGPDLVPGVFAFIKALAEGVRSVRKA